MKRKRRSKNKEQKKGIKKNKRTKLWIKVMLLVYLLSPKMDRMYKNKFRISRYKLSAART